VVDRKDPASRRGRLTASSPAFAPVIGDRAVPDLSVRLLRDGDPSARRVGALERHERGLGAERGGEDAGVGVEQTVLGVIPAMRAKASPLGVRSGMAKDSSSCTGPASVSTVPRSPGDQNAALACSTASALALGSDLSVTS
jgi:hypothetical protein